MASTMTRDRRLSPRGAVLGREHSRRTSGRRALLRRTVRLGVRRARRDARRPPGEYSWPGSAGLDVAGIGASAVGPAPPAGWTTHVRGGQRRRCGRPGRRRRTRSRRAVDAAPAGRWRSSPIRPAPPSACGRRGARRGPARQRALGVGDEPAAARPTRRERGVLRPVFGWQAEPFPDGGPGSLAVSPARYVGGEPQQPVPRDVVAAMVALPQVIRRSQWNADFWIADAERAAVAAPAAALAVRP